ncbi:HEPN domain-containing protein [Paenibacillus cremeus]|uniref:HEPN domain-containing protein n=1 Tax=Paenibacillus cremeus TaxID=2163881 RepID=A0A559KI91_9BACL|nr:HEPN domain-containing protein [Paenibacillus cremeus]TVY11854.1 HEPN domain-containing protein [Paenibacillus cremeus]
MRYSKAAETMLRKAQQKYKLAELSFENGLYDGCVSELYYSAFQTVTALILLRGETVSNKHTYVRGWVNKNLGQTGQLSPHLVKVYNRLMDHRADADYSAEVSFGQVEVSGLMAQVETFNEAVLQIINNEKGNQE